MKHQNVIFTNSVGDALNKAVEQLSPRNVFVLTDENVERESLASFRLHSEWQKIVIPAGDINKNLDSAQAVWNALQKGGATRKSLLVKIVVEQFVVDRFSVEQPVLQHLGIA